MRFLLLSILALLGCGQEQWLGNESRLNVVNGTEAAPDVQEVSTRISLVDEQFGKVPLYSGVQISRSVFLTAAHCLVRIEPSQLEISISDDSGPALTTTGARFYWFEKTGEGVRIRAESESGGPQFLDLALIVSASDSSGSDSEARIGSSADGDLVSLAGYGKILKGCSSFSDDCVGRLYQLEGSVKEAESPEFLGREVSEVISEPGSGGCNFDSGGGVFQREGKTLAVVGVIMGDISGGPDSCSNGRTAFTRLDFWTYKQWTEVIHSMRIIDADAPGNVRPDSQSSNRPCERE